MHWGLEKLPVPPQHIRYIARELKQFGANLTIGTHPHVPQNYQCIGENYFVAYSLGNLLFVRTGVPNAVSFVFLDFKNVFCFRLVELK